jgi:hypothetical protein
MAYIATLDAPDAGEMTASLRSNLELRLVFHGKRPPHSQPTARLLYAYLLVVDKAVREYEAGRSALLKHIHGGGIPSFTEGVGHFETCINTLKRALRLLTMLGTKSDAPAFDRTLRKLAQSRSEEITGVRDAIEHIDQDILTEGGLAEGEAHLLTVDRTGEKLQIAKHEISFRTLHTTIDALYKAGLAMINALPNLA